MNQFIYNIVIFVPVIFVGGSSYNPQTTNISQVVQNAWLPLSQVSMFDKASSQRSSRSSNSGNTMVGLNITNLNGQSPGQFGVGLAQFALENNAQAKTTIANSGNNIKLGNITGSSIVSAQNSHHNNASSLLDFDTNSGNILYLGDMRFSDLLMQQVSTYNDVQSEKGDANSGNSVFFNNIQGGLGDFSQISSHNTGFSIMGESNGGNILSFASLSGRKLQKHQDIF
eukprot:TRINITY_DN13938_c0_g1_i1.p1 TRINITY_DN13938_c0_g1~~TRINITY_DN13938_c0_g1_i1.p1  ORF type:complete len:265 (-),score=13.13 TRINITY_DN13938_c0_g1_i1:250-930(-)